MRHRIVIPLVFFIFLAQPCAGQSDHLSKKTIQKLLKASIKQEPRKKFQVGNNAWTACNKDSSFFTRDTVIFDNSKSITCCATVQWTFYKKDAFVQNMAQACKEPSSSTVTKIEDFYRIDLIDKNTFVIMQTSNNAGKQINFRVVSVDKKNRSIKLVRIKQTDS